jgi:hypothetical protein
VPRRGTIRQEPLEPLTRPGKDSLKKKGLIEKVRERRKDPLRRGPAVFETGAARKGMDGPAGPGRGARQGRYRAVLRFPEKRSDGGWRCAHGGHHGSTPRRVPHFRLWVRWSR